MDINRILQMIMRMVGRRVVNKGIDHALSGGRSRQDMSAQERQQMRQSKQNVRRARQAARLTKRMGKF